MIFYHDISAIEENLFNIKYSLINYFSNVLSLELRSYANLKDSADEMKSFFL